LSLEGKSQRERWLSWGICIGLLLAVCAVFGQTLGFGFVNYDDNDYIYKNPRVTAGLAQRSMTPK